MATNYLAHYAADNSRLERSRSLVALANGVWNVIRVPRFAFVKNVWLQVISAWDATGTIEIGFSGNGETANQTFFMDMGMTEPNVLGMKSADIGKYFLTNSGMITFYTNGGTGTAGTALVFADYCIIH